VELRGQLTGAQRREHLLGGLAPQVVEDGVERPLGMGGGDTGAQVVLADRDDVVGANGA
jgi:hypothetical protein